MKLLSIKLSLKLVCVLLTLAQLAEPSEATLKDYLPSFRFFNPLYWLGWSRGPVNAANATSVKPTINRSDYGHQNGSSMAQATSKPVSKIIIRPATTPSTSSNASSAAYMATTRYYMSPETTTLPAFHQVSSALSANRSSYLTLPDPYTPNNGSILNLFTTQKPRDKPNKLQMKYIIKKKNNINATLPVVNKPSFAIIR